MKPTRFALKSDDELTAHINDAKHPCKAYKQPNKVSCYYCTRKCESVDDLKEHMIFKHYDYMTCPFESCKKLTQGFGNLYHHFRIYHPTHLQTNKELFNFHE